MVNECEVTLGGPYIDLVIDGVPFWRSVSLLVLLKGQSYLLIYSMEQSPS